MDTNNLKLLLKYAFFLGFFMLLMVWLSQPIEGKKVKKITFPEGTFDSQRHLVWVNIDSLMILFNSVNSDKYYEFDRKKEKLILKIVEANHVSSFQKVFLDGKTIEDFTTLKNSPIKKLKNDSGISLPIKKQNDADFVHIPVEILQSVLNN
jgi:hypothetical protein